MHKNGNKKVKRSKALSKQSHLEVIRVNRQRQIDRSSTLNPVKPRLENSNSKSGSSELPQNSLEDHSGMKLLSESMSWPSFFCTLKDHAQLLIMYACIRKRNGWRELCNCVWTGWNGMEASPFFLLLLYLRTNAFRKVTWHARENFFAACYAVRMKTKETGRQSECLLVCFSLQNIVG